MRTRLSPDRQVSAFAKHNKVLDKYAYDQLTNDEDVLVYANQVKEAMESGLIRFVAHTDYFMIGRRSWSKACEEAAHN